MDRGVFSWIRWVCIFCGGAYGGMVIEPSFRQTWFLCPKVWTKVARWSNGKIPLSIAFSSCKISRIKVKSDLIALPAGYKNSFHWHADWLTSIHQPVMIPYLVMEAGTKIVRNKEKVVSSFWAIPIRPVWGDQLDCTPHNPRWFKGQGKPIWCQITCGIHRGIKPICFFWI